MYLLYLNLLVTLSKTIYFFSQKIMWYKNGLDIFCMFMRTLLEANRDKSDWEWADNNIWILPLVGFGWRKLWTGLMASELPDFTTCRWPFLVPLTLRWVEWSAKRFCTHLFINSNSWELKEVFCVSSVPDVKCALNMFLQQLQSYLFL